ncbi:RNA-dependent RNA polymerase [Hubei rhabdo-like virus 3]|uniref:RNA-directed RNA polymerase L n=1 Tax=Hubei rhabdo-like virus 3 TaxID=1923187 RepID=A0A1L3KMP6_9MONO|nr:RNA-dependent RNA polymerase [Hubei rhabdo-like virus 3]APG78691.1 RNA-dependent RNA polymerase [Hubei rhabdo-like virus 3]
MGLKIPDSHLQSPIRDVFRIYFHLSENRIPGFLRGCIASCPVPRKKILLNSEKIYGLILSGVYTNQLVLHWTSECFPATVGIVQSHARDVLKGLGLQDYSNECDYVPDIEDMRRYSEKVKWEDIRICMQKLRETPDKWKKSNILPHSLIEVWFCAQFLIARSIDHQYYLLDYDQVMMVTDTISSRVFVLLYHRMLQEHLPGKVSEDVILNCFKAFDELFFRDGNSAYSQIKNWEAIIISILIKKYDRLPTRDVFFNQIHNELEKDGCDIALHLMEFLDSLGLSADILSEIHGFFRLWGHPTVDEEKGCVKVKNIAQHRPDPNGRTLLEMDGLFVRQYCVSFMKKHGRWPRLKTTYLRSKSQLKRAVLSHTTAIDLYSPNFPLDDWAALELEQELEFDYFPDFTEIIDDKSISVERDDLRTLYNKWMLGYDPGEPKTSRRLLLEVLRLKDVDIKSVCQDVGRRNIPKNQKIIVVHAKERELKNHPRLFAMMPVLMRLFYVAIEANIKEKIFEYFPQQTMTLTEIALNARLFNLTESSESDHYFICFCHIDFTSWNLHWTGSAVSLLSRRLEQLFDTPGYYSGGHWFFSQCLIALASHHNPPVTLINNERGEVSECDTLWFNHIGGFEGIMQKLWTLQTIILLLLVEFKTGIRSIITGQGDNQVIKLLIPLEEQGLNKDQYIVKYQDHITESLTKFVHCLSEKAGDLGLKVKIEESYTTTDILVYGKRIILNGAFLPQASKRIARTLTDVNEIYPSLSSKISTLQTAGLAAAQHGFTIVIPYVICQMETLFTIERDIEWSLLLRGSQDIKIIQWIKKKYVMRFLLLYTGDLGGPPILPFLAFFYRGHPDSLTTCLTEIYLMKSSNKLALDLWAYLEALNLETGKGNIELLILNPCSLNIDTPSSLASIYKHFLTKELPDITTNKWLSQVFGTDTSEEEQRIMKYLVNTRPFHPRILHEIFLNTVPGARSAFASKFSTTRTTQVLGSSRDESGNLIKQVKKSEQGWINYWFECYLKFIEEKTEHTDSQLHDPCTLAQTLRRYTWGGSLPGVSLEGITVPHPAHQFIFNICASADHTSCIGAQERVTISFISSDTRTILMSRGPYPSYLGSRTREKRTGKIIVIPQTGRPLHAAERLSQIQSWCIPDDSRLCDFIKSLVGTRTDLPIELVKLSAGFISSGSIVHRLDDHVTKRNAQHNILTNITTHGYLTCDMLGRFSRGQDNYNMHIQGIILLNFSLINMIAVTREELPNLVFSMHYNPASAEEVLEDVSLSNKSSLPPVTVRKDNPLLYTAVRDAPFMSDVLLTNYLLVRDNSDDYAAAHVLLARIISSLNARMEGITDYSLVTLSNLGVQEILRVTLRRIIRALSILLILLLPYSATDLRVVLNLLPLKIWADITPLCLLPEILPELFELSGVFLPDLFVNPYQISRLLVRALSIEVEKQLKIIEDSEMMWNPRVTFYITQNIGVRRVFFMWGRLILLTSKEKYNILKMISHQKLGGLSNVNLPSSSQLASLNKEILKDYGLEGLRYCWTQNKIRISKDPPESKMRLREKPLPKLAFSGRQLRQATIAHRGKISNEGYPFKILFPLGSLDIELFDPNYSATVSIAPNYNHMDHMYHLRGHTSSSYLKVLEILVKEEILEVKSSLIVGDGEGGIARMVADFYNIDVYFNTLVDRSKLIPHRAACYVPASFIDQPSKVRLAHLSALNGGNLLESKVIHDLIENIHEDIECIISDAELLPGGPKEYIQLLRNILFLAFNLNTECVIFKCYYYNPLHVCDLLGLGNTLFSDVRLIIPTFSSNETSEVYLYLAARREDSESIRCYTADYLNKFYRSSSARSAYAIISPTLLNRHTALPHQLNRKERVKELFALSDDLGIPKNLSVSIERYALNLLVFSHETSIVDYLDNAGQVARSCAIKELRGFALSQEGTPLSPELKIIMSGHRSIHLSVERYLKVCINCKTLSRIILNYQTLQQAYVEIKNTIESPHELLSDKGEMLYSLRLDWVVWKKEFLKLFWVILGHAIWNY